MGKIFFKTIAILIFVTSFIGGILFFFEKRPKQYFPLTDTEARYSIQELGPHYGVLFQKVGHSANNAMILVGSAPVSLELFMGKSVSIEGKFRSNDGEIICRPRQEDQCGKIKALVIDIQEIQRAP